MKRRETHEVPLLEVPLLLGAEPPAGVGWCWRRPAFSVHTRGALVDGMAGSAHAYTSCAGLPAAVAASAAAAAARPRVAKSAQTRRRVE